MVRHAATYSEPLLLVYFREFYQYVRQLERQIKNNTCNGLSETPEADPPGASTTVSDKVATTERGMAGGPVTVQPGGSGAATALARSNPFPAIQQRLLFCLERQARRAQTEGAEFYHEAQYIMAALADEVFIQLDWEGKQAWMSSLLESRLFHSHAAGQLFFKRLDHLLQERDPALRDLAAVYLMALSLGFRGKYRGCDDQGQLARYRQQLFLFIFQRAPDPDQLGPLLPDAYFSTLQGKRKRKLPYVRIWLLLLGLAVAVWLGAAHLIWQDLVTPLNERNGRIADLDRELHDRPGK